MDGVVHWHVGVLLRGHVFYRIRIVRYLGCCYRRYRCFFRGRIVDRILRRVVVVVVFVGVVLVVGWIVFVVGERVLRMDYFVGVVGIDC